MKCLYVILGMPNYPWYVYSCRTPFPPFQAADRMTTK